MAAIIKEHGYIDTISFSGSAPDCVINDTSGYLNPPPPHPTPPPTPTPPHPPPHPSAAYMRQWTGAALVLVMVCRLCVAKPLHEPMLAYWEQF